MIRTLGAVVTPLVFALGLNLTTTSAAFAGNGSQCFRALPMLATFVEPTAQNPHGVRLAFDAKTVSRLDRYGCTGSKIAKLLPEWSNGDYKSQALAAFLKDRLEKDPYFADFRYARANVDEAEQVADACPTPSKGAGLHNFAVPVIGEDDKVLSTPTSATTCSKA